MTRDEALARFDLPALLEDIGAAQGLHRKGKAFPCPIADHAQTGATPPCTVAPDPAGYDVWHCHTCSRGGSAIDALLLSGRAKDLAEAMEAIGAREPERRVPEAPAQEVAHYVYQDERGNALFRVVRLEPKSFRQQRFEDGRWQWGLGETRRVLYRLPQLLAALARNDIVFICEGEKDVHAIEAAGFTATTLPGGAGKWRDEYTATFPPGARVIVMADDDEPGRKHAADVVRRLYGRVGRVWGRLPAEGCKDVSEHLAAGHRLTNADLRPLVTEAAPVNGTAVGPQMFTAKVFASRPAPDRALRVVGPLFQRGMRTTIGAQTGEGKTTLALQAVKALITGEPFLDEAWRPAAKGRALIVDLEQGEETIKQRLMEAELHTSEAVDVLWEPAGLALESDPAHQALIRDTIKQGRYDLVVLDPLYQMHRGNPNDERTAADLMRIVDTWARDFGFALVIPMHARKPHPQAGIRFTINEIAGSASWNRNAEFVLGLKLMGAGSSTLHFFKDRIGQGPGIGTKWWLAFDREHGFSRTFKEDKDALRETLKGLTERAAGVTEEELVAAGADEVFMKRVRKNCHLNGDRWRAQPWHEQTTLADDMT